MREPSIIKSGASKIACRWSAFLQKMANVSMFKIFKKNVKNLKYKKKTHVQNTCHCNASPFKQYEWRCIYKIYLMQIFYFAEKTSFVSQSMNGMVRERQDISLGRWIFFSLLFTGFLRLKISSFQKIIKYIWYASSSNIHNHDHYYIYLFGVWMDEQIKHMTTATVFCIVYYHSRF